MSVAERNEARLLWTGNPALFVLLRAARYTGRIRRIPKLGWIVTDPALARRILKEDSSFDMIGEGGIGHMWIQLFGEEMTPLFAGAGHLEFRTTVRELFTEDSAARLVERSQGDHFRSIGKRLAEGETVDIAASARLLSGRMISNLLGLDLDAEMTQDPDRAYNEVFDVGLRLATFALGTESDTALPASVLAEAREIIDYLTRNIDASYPEASNETVLGRCRELGYSVNLARGVGTLLAVAGTETGSSAMARTIALLHDTGQTATLLADPTLIDGTVREGLRVTTPAPTIGRHVRRDAEVDGRRLRAGERVMLLISVANNRPGRFDITRDYLPENRQLWFGAGRHLCLGAAIARAQVRRMVETLTEQGRPWRVVSRQAARKVVVPAYESLLVRLD